MDWLIVILGIVIYVAVTTFAEKNEGWWAAFVLVLGIGIYGFVLHKDVFKEVLAYIINEPGVIVIGILLWILIGVLWSFYKWYLFLKAEKKNNPTVNAGYYNASENKDKIIPWMIYWPFSMTWFIIHDPITRLYEWIYDRVARVYDNIQKSVFK